MRISQINLLFKNICKDICESDRGITVPEGPWFPLQFSTTLPLRGVM